MQCGASRERSVEKRLLGGQAPARAALAAAHYGPAAVVEIQSVYVHAYTHVFSSVQVLQVDCWPMDSELAMPMWAAAGCRSG